MKIRKLAAMLLTLSLSLAASPSALAHSHVCSPALDALGATIGSSDFKNQRDQDRLGLKVVAADSKLLDGKPYDALHKRDNIRTKIDGLVADRKTKINKYDAADILGDVGDAEDCILGHVAEF